MNTEVNRRSFLGGMLAAGSAPLFFPGCATPLTAARPRLRVGVLSDTHIKEPAPTCASAVSTAFYGDGFRQRLPTSSESFRHALEYYRDRNVDAVLIAGDMCDLGLKSQFRTVRSIWDEVFPGDRAPDGHHVERLFITGNHEWGSWDYKCTNKLWPDYDDRRSRAFVSDPKGIWEKTFDEPYEPIFIKTVKGYDFVLAHYAGKTGVPALPAFLEKHRARLGGAKPFFYAQHLHPRGTCSSPLAAADNGTATEALSTFPNCVAFTGHSHKSLGDERTIWQGAFTSVGCASLRFVQTLDPVDNGNCGAGLDSSPMMPLDAYEGRQGMVMEVFDDRIVLERRDFLRDRSMGADWVIPLDPKERPYRFDTRAANEPKPRFPAGAKVEAMRVPVRFRDGVIRDAFALKFPPVIAAFGAPRTGSYEIAATVGEVKYPARRVLSPGALFAEADDTADVVSVYPADEIPAGAVVDFTVTPLGCFGTRGIPLNYRFDASNS